MPFLKLINEWEHKSYDGIQGTKNLIYYIFQPSKTAIDMIRPLPVLVDYGGCEPFIFPRIYETSPEHILDYFVTNNSIFHKCNTKDIAKHRLVSFSPADYVLPFDVNQLGRLIINYYAAQGYIAAFAVHLDTYHLHLHIAVNAISYANGNRFHIVNEYTKLQMIMKKWFEEHMEMIDSSYVTKEKYENVLFGDSINPYGKTAISVKSQMWNVSHMV